MSETIGLAFGHAHSEQEARAAADAWGAAEPNVASMVIESVTLSPAGTRWTVVVTVTAPESAETVEQMGLGL